MDISKKILMAAVYAGISQSELARRIETSPQSLNQRIKRGTFAVKDLENIADALNCECRIDFVFHAKDGMEEYII